MLTFENAVIKKFWPKDEKGDEDEIIRQVNIQSEVELDNSIQVGELYNNMVRGLVRVTLLDTLSGEEYILPAASIKPFNIKQKKVKIGKGDEAETVKSEYAAINIVTKIDEEKGGQLLADIYRYFNFQIQMTFEELKPFEHAQESSENSEASDDSIPLK